jgi:hypothetical protein
MDGLNLALFLAAAFFGGLTSGVSGFAGGATLVHVLPKSFDELRNDPQNELLTAAHRRERPLRPS